MGIGAPHEKTRVVMATAEIGAEGCSQPKRGLTPLLGTIHEHPCGWNVNKKGVRVSDDPSTGGLGTLGLAREQESKSFATLLSRGGPSLTTYTKRDLDITCTIRCPNGCHGCYPRSHERRESEPVNPRARGSMQREDNQADVRHRVGEHAWPIGRARFVSTPRSRSSNAALLHG
jgi:hypothetical protein